MLRFAEELLVLMLDEGRGEVAPGLPSHSLSLALAGAVLMDLALEDRIDTDLERLMLVDSTPLGDDCPCGTRSSRAPRRASARYS